MAKRKENLNREKALEQFKQLLIYKPEIFRGTPATLICSGKQNCGRPTEVWEEYVAGLDPTNANSQLKAMIEMLNGAPIVTWDPNLNTNGVVRTYKVYGRETLENGGEWQYPTNSLHRFFKVTVEMP